MLEIRNKSRICWKYSAVVKNETEVKFGDLWSEMWKVRYLKKLQRSSGKKIRKTCKTETRVYFTFSRHLSPATVDTTVLTSLSLSRSSSYHRRTPYASPLLCNLKQASLWTFPSSDERTPTRIKTSVLHSLKLLPNRLSIPTFSVFIWKKAKSIENVRKIKKCH